MRGRTKPIGIACAIITAAAICTIIAVGITATRMPEPEWWRDARMESEEPGSGQKERDEQRHRVAARFASGDIGAMEKRITNRVRQSQGKWSYRPAVFRRGYIIRTEDPDVVADLLELDRRGARLTPGYARWNPAARSEGTPSHEIATGNHKVMLLTKGVKPHTNMRRAMLGLGILAGIAGITGMIAAIEHHDQSLTYHNTPATPRRT